MKSSAFLLNVFGGAPAIILQIFRPWEKFHICCMILVRFRYWVPTTRDLVLHWMSRYLGAVFRVRVIRWIRLILTIFVFLFLDYGLTASKWIIISVLIFFILHLIRLLIAMAFITLFLTLTLIPTRLQLLNLIGRRLLFVWGSHVVLGFLARIQFQLATFFFNCSICILLVLHSSA